MLVLLILSAILLFLACLLCTILFYKRRRTGIPGPCRRFPFFGLAFRLLTMTEKDILPMFQTFFDKFGSIFELEMLGNVYIILRDPENIETILGSTVHTTKGDWEYSFFRPWLRDGLLLSSGDKWRHRRKLLTPSFHFKILETSLMGISKYSEEFAEGLLATGGKPFEIIKNIRSTTLKIICETAMGVTLNTDEEDKNKFMKDIEKVLDGIVYRYFRFWLYSDVIYKISKAGQIFFNGIRTLQKFTKSVIKKRKTQYTSQKRHNNNVKKDKRKAFLDQLLELDQLNPGFFSEADILEEVDTFMFEGHDTVTSALLFAHFLLANHPQVQDKAFDEQLEIFGCDDRMPTIQDLQKMTYLEMVIKETLRLYPSVPYHTRQLQKDMRLNDDIVVPKGHTIGILTYFVHRTEKHWPEPEMFVPERFTPGVERHPFSYIPFSAGPRNCIGQKYAMMEMKTIISTVLRKCILEPVTTSVFPVSLVILRSKEPVLVKVRPRKQTSF